MLINFMYSLYCARFGLYRARSIRHWEMGRHQCSSMDERRKTNSLSIVHCRSKGEGPGMPRYFCVGFRLEFAAIVPLATHIEGRFGYEAEYEKECNLHTQLHTHKYLFILILASYSRWRTLFRPEYGCSDPCKVHTHTHTHRWGCSEV